MNEIQIPRYIDNQPQFLMWELDEFCIAVGLFGVGIITETMWTSIALIILISGILKKFKKNNLEGALLHIVFWSGVTSMNKENLDAFDRELIA
jgi:conjugal transfer pilus assembly protein TraL